MKTTEFIATLRRSPHKQLIFAASEGAVIPAGYHLTEIKAASFETVDCGGEINRWQETIVQLWVPSETDDEYMSAGKFLRIYDQVSGMAPLNSDAEIRVEYGDENFFPSNYHVHSIAEDTSTIRAQLRAPATTCKARDRARKAMGNAEAACCAA